MAKATNGCATSREARPASSGFQRWFRILLPVAAATALGACSSTADPTTGFATAAVAPIKTEAATTRQVAHAQPIRRGGGYYTVGQPYRIAGKTYVPREEPHYSKVGVASWYGYDFHGRKTANGEIYDLDAVTAAHPTLPLPSYARVTNLDNGRSIVVRINDRGPFVDDRIIDVSRTVARKLDFEHDGTVKVRVDYIGPASLEGNDETMLLASFQNPGAPPAPTGGPMVMVAAAQLPATAPRPSSAVATAAVATATNDSGLLLLSTGLPYSEPVGLTPAHQATETMGRADLTARLTIAAAKRASELRLGPASQ